MHVPATVTHDTGHIHTAISWMKERVKDLKKKPQFGRLG